MKWRRIMLAAATLAGSVAVVAQASPVSAETTTWSATETIPVPPASTYQGAGGGDGWAVALTDDSVYNVFHHASTLRVACHRQADASECYPAKTVSDPLRGQFSTSNHPGLWIDADTGRLYVYATLNSTATAGVVCVDTADEANPNPFCGFTALTADGATPNGRQLGSPALAAGKWYAFNYVGNVGADGTRNHLLCFDTATLAACDGQPFAMNLGPAGGTVTASSISPISAAIGGWVFVPVVYQGTAQMACYSPVTGGNCAGSWPTPIPSIGVNGAPYPLLNSSGNPEGFCLPSAGAPCWDFGANTYATPPGLAGTVASSSPYSGPAFTLGPRVYVPNGNLDQVHCYNFSAQASCANFPKSFANLGYLYTVNPDPARPTCIWVNADNGSGQIQNFDAYSGGSCGDGPIRVLASSIVADSPECVPTTYSSLQVLDPGPDGYGSGSVSFADGDATPIPGVSDMALDGTGTVDITGLGLNTVAGLPQFLITLNDPVGGIGEVTVRLTWTGENLQSCNPGPGNSEPLKMVALGDSYTSGEGTSNYDEHKEAQKCHRGPDAWPRIVEQKTVEVTEIDHRACSGAKTPQMLDAWKSNPRQIPYAVDPDVDLVVLTIGGNDIGFSGILTDCVIGFTCADDPYSKGFEKKLDKLYRKLSEDIYPEIRRAYKNARIVHVGYPELFPRRDEVAINCGWLTPDEQTALQVMAEKLNGTIWKAAQDTTSDVEFVDVADVLDGHELCTSDSWVYPIRSKWPSEQGHPTYWGQVSYARQVAAALGLTWLDLPEF